MTKSRLALGALMAFASCAQASEPLSLQPQPTFSYLGSGWRYEPPKLPDAQSILARPAGERPVYGLYCWADEYLRFRPQIRAVGWPNLRISGPMNDAAMEAFARDGVEVMMTLATRVHGSFTPDAPFSQWRNRADYDSDEAFIADYLRGVTRFLERWGPGGTFFKENPDVPNRPIRAVEIWNEPNFWYLDMTAAQFKERMQKGLSNEEREAREARRAKLYAKLLSASYAAIKARWPDVTVVGFAAGGSSVADVPFIRGVHEAQPSVATSYDVLSTHPYLGPSCAPEGVTMKKWGEYSIGGSLDAIRQTMTQHGSAHKPVWYSEHGWPIAPRLGGAFRDAFGTADTTRQPPQVSADGIPADTDPRKWIDPLTQAAYNTRMYAFALRLGVERHFFMSVVDTDGFNSGFLHRDGTLRPAAVAAKAMMELMPHPQLVEVVSDGKDGVFIYRFDPDATKANDRPVTMAWSVEIGRDAFALPPGKSEVITMLGERKTLDAARVELGPCPLYFRSAEVTR